MKRKLTTADALMVSLGIIASSRSFGGSICNLLCESDNLGRLDFFALTLEPSLLTPKYMITEKINMKTL